jgi:hypothetical protein
VLPLAHAGHYALWILYALPVLIVAFAIAKSFVSQRRAENASPAGGREGEVEHDPARRPPPP